MNIVNRLRLSTLAMAITLLLLSIQQNYAGPLAQMRAFRLGQSLTRQPTTVWLRVFYPFPIDVVEKKYVPVKIPIPVYVNGKPPNTMYPNYHLNNFSSNQYQYQSTNLSPKYLLPPTASTEYQSY
ncbi:hypothetical protein BLA29_009509 [Euroglyphus maynei]|uniref:DFP2-like protein n=1 Tax=Euroglyphus maynei TaxID=6958 RepID=A0A1Y3BJS5_EURMA|nr:hypothetical protein BLA29_009509 [Euroglyphus maynei]